MAKRPGNRLIQSDAASAGRAQARQAVSWMEREHARRGTLPLSAIRLRPGGDSRALKPNHVLNLAESIDAVGLVEPPAVDCEGHLLAGAHRLAALKLLAQPDSAVRVKIWLEISGLDETHLTVKQQADIERLTALSSLDTEEVPVMILPFNAEDDAARALAIETSENTQRKSYSRDEISMLVQRLREAGFVEREGRPKAGEKALRPALSLVLGKSTNTVRRWLGVLDATPKTCPNGQVFMRQKAEYRLLLAVKNYRRILAENALQINQDLQKCLEDMESLLSDTR
ncbi:MAG: hypothetical protein KDI50_02955 [Candidatus Competibacteraceae bacterium]|nr:hypothetical protein [Candidatus Competibacteraceae bacterium]